MPLLLVCEVAFALELAEHGSNRRVRRRVRQIFEDFSDRGLSACVDRVHDLALASCELGECVAFHVQCYSSSRCATTVASERQPVNRVPHRTCLLFAEADHFDIQMPRTSIALTRAEAY